MVVEIKAQGVGNRLQNAVAAEGCAGHGVHISRLGGKDFRDDSVLCPAKKPLVVLIGFHGDAGDDTAGYGDGNVGGAAEACSGAGIDPVRHVESGASGRRTAGFVGGFGGRAAVRILLCDGFASGLCIRAGGNERVCHRANNVLAAEGRARYRVYIGALRRQNLGDDRILCPVEKFLVISVGQHFNFAIEPFSTVTLTSVSPRNPRALPV